MAKKIDNAKCYKDAEQWEFSCVLLTMQNGTTTLNETLTVSYKGKHSLTKLSRNHTPRYLTNLFINLCPHKSL